MSVVIQSRNLSKIYRLGQFNTGSLATDLERWWALFRGKEDDIVAGFLTGFLALLAVVYLYQSVKVAGDAI